ncbi:hypothetical protein [Halalkalibacter oceani]|uniref:hypothetical protein n=1 Tax=Halalkalibacter oceani TaxID=1653776 RepID=UPI003393757F
MGKQSKKIQKTVSKKEPLLSSVLKEEVQMYDEFIDIPFVPIGHEKEIVIRMYPLFKPEKVRDCVADYFSFIAQCKKEQIVIQEVEVDDILGYFIIKHFTNAKLTKGKKAKTVYDEFKILINSHFYKELISYFPEESIKSVHNRRFELIETVGKMEKQFNQINEELAKLPLENREAIEKAFGKIGIDQSADEVVNNKPIQ